MFINSNGRYERMSDGKKWCGCFGRNTDVEDEETTTEKLENALKYTRIKIAEHELKKISIQKLKKREKAIESQLVNLQDARDTVKLVEHVYATSAEITDIMKDVDVENVLESQRVIDNHRQDIEIIMEEEEEEEEEKQMIEIIRPKKKPMKQRQQWEPPRVASEALM